MPEENSLTKTHGEFLINPPNLENSGTSAINLPVHPQVVNNFYAPVNFNNAPSGEINIGTAEDKKRSRLKNLMLWIFKRILPVDWLVEIKDFFDDINK